MTEYSHDVVYCGVRVEGGIRPCSNDLLDRMADDDDSHVAGGFVEKTAEVI